MAAESSVRCSRRRRPEPEPKAQHGLQRWSEPRVQSGAPLVLSHGAGGCLGVRTHGGGSGGGSRRKSGGEGHSLHQVPDGDGDLQHGGDGCMESDDSFSGRSVQWRKQATTGQLGTTCVSLSDSYRRNDAFSFLLDGQQHNHNNRSIRRSRSEAKGGFHDEFGVYPLFLEIEIVSHASGDLFLAMWHAAPSHSAFHQCRQPQQGWIQPTRGRAAVNGGGLLPSCSALEKMNMRPQPALA